MHWGFDWSPANIEKGEDDLDLDLESATAPKPVYWGKDAPKKWNHVRTHTLRDHSENGAWFASLHVFAMEAETLENFDFKLLSMKTLRRQVAYDWNREVVYSAHQSDKTAYNTIAKQTPVGWWLRGTIKPPQEDYQSILAKK